MSNKLTPPEVGSYGGAAVSIASGLTLTQVGVAVGIVTALLTFALNVYLGIRRDKREQIETEARLRAMGQG